MRARLPLLYSVLAFAILMGPQAARAAQDKKATPPSAKDLVGIWIGFDSDQSLSPALIFVSTRPDSVLACPLPTQFCTLRVSTFTE